MKYKLLLKYKWAIALFYLYLVLKYNVEKKRKYK